MREKSELPAGEISAKIEPMLEGMNVLCLGETISARFAFSLHTIPAELDATSYPNGQTTYQVEVRGQKSERERIRKELGLTGEYVQAPSKKKALFAALKKSE